MSYTNLKYHVVFSTKDRWPYLEPSVRERLYQYMVTVCEELGCPVIKIGGVEDHVHLLIALSRTMTISEFVQKLKAKSSRWVKQFGGNFEKFAWQCGYGAFSVSQSQMPKVVDYIANQEEHHRKQTFQNEFRALLRSHKIKFDEKYVWD